MIVTDKFVFIHMHKTGGQSLNQILSKSIPSFREEGYHYPHHLLPAEHAHLPVIGMVRNPWDWYISWYAFNTRPDVRNSLFYAVSDGWQSDFRQTIRNLINLGADTFESQNRRNALVKVLPDTLEGNKGIGLTKDCIREFQDNDKGYLSWQFQRMHGDLDNPTTHIGRFENLQQEFLSLMEKCSVEQVDNIRREFENTTHLNKSSHNHYSRYYDDELNELVMEKEQLIIDRYGYQFDTSDDEKEHIPLPRKQLQGVTDSFQKLDGKAANFLLLNSDVEIKPILKKLAQIPEKIWAQSGREKSFEAHRQTQSLMLIHDDDFRHFNPTEQPLYSRFKKALSPLTDFIAEYYNHDGFIGRILIAKLKARGKIPTHVDGGYSLVKCNRIHIPLITNDKAIFSVGGESKVLKAGEMWEINNATFHAVDNNSDQDRTHLIIDWIPNETVREVDKMPKPTAPSVRQATVNGTAMKVGRNAPCPCQSGKKYKNCHGALQ